MTKGQVSWESKNRIIQTTCICSVVVEKRNNKSSLGPKFKAGSDFFHTILCWIANKINKYASCPLPLLSVLGVLVDDLIL